MSNSAMSNVNNGARLIALSLLSGGAAMVTFVAVTLVKAAKAEGVAVTEAAFRNGPAFINFSYIALGAAAILLVTELIDYMSRKKEASSGFLSKSLIVRYVSSLVCALLMIVFSVVFAMPMGKLMPEIRTNEAAHEQFDKLHNGSRIVFGIGILFGFISLVIPNSMPMRKPNDD